MSISVLIWLATEWASLDYVDEARLELKIHIPNIDVGSGSHIGSGGDRELAESLFSHSLKNEWCFRNGFLCREDSERRNDARSCPSHEPLWIVCVVFRQGEIGHTLPLSSFKSKSDISLKE